jgi:peptide/nickel transport system permease protein
MWRFALRQSGTFALGVIGALIFAAAVSALADAHARDGAVEFLLAAAGRAYDFARLEFGGSAITGLAAAEELAFHAPVTAMLVLLGAVVAIVIGVPMGMLLGASALRRTTAPFIQAISAAPVFVAGLALAYVAQRFFGWPPSDGEFPKLALLLHPDRDAVRIVLMPALTVGLAGAAAIQLALRRAASVAQDYPFRLGLRRLGLSSLEIERVYVAPIVIAGLFDSLGEVMLALLSAAVVSEWVFKAPGAADLFVKSVALHDWNMAALILFFFAVAVLFVSFLGRLAARAIAAARNAP